MGLRNKYGIFISPGICIGLAFWILVLPLKWIFAMIVAAALHEICHYGMVRMVGGRVLSVQIGSSGADMEVAELSRGKELVCALAGPVGGLMLMIFARWIPRIAICGAVQALYNLIPVYPLDGGRAVRCAAMMVLPPDKAETVCIWAERIVLGGIGGLAVYGTFWLDLGLFPVLLAIFLVLKTKYRKIPCKAAGQRVQ